MDLSLELMIYQDKLFPSFDIESLEYNPDKPDYCRYIMNQVSWIMELDSFILTMLWSVIPPSPTTNIASPWRSPFVTEFSMSYCDESKQLWVPLFNSFFMIGLGIGSLLFWILSDNFGRRNSLVMAIILCSGASDSGSFMPKYWSYALLRIPVGVGSEGCFIVAFTISMEIVGVREHVPGLPWLSYNTFQGPS